MLLKLSFYHSPISKTLNRINIKGVHWLEFHERIEGELLCLRDDFLSGTPPSVVYDVFVGAILNHLGSGATRIDEPVKRRMPQPKW